MTINIISVGKLQQDLKKIQDSYLKKIAFFAKLNFIELKEMSHDSLEVKIKKETANILKAIPKGSKTFLLSLQGKAYSSPQFSDLLASCGANITFIIGGSNGVDESQFKDKITFSKMTFPHQFFKIMLIEQIFRGLTIKNNMKYHK